MTIMDSKTSPKKYKELANFKLCHKEQAKPWAALLYSIVAAMFVVAFFVGLGLLVGAFLVHRVARRIKAWIRGEQPPLD
jgi:short subunit fatty acids transporter